MRMLKVMLPAAALVAGFLALTTISQAKPAYSKKENKKVKNLKAATS